MYQTNGGARIETNLQIAEKLRDFSSLLHQQGGNPFRARAYRRAAATVDSLEESLLERVAAHGRRGLIALPGIGPGIAAAILEMIQTGRWTRLDRLRGTLDPVTLFQTIPGIGKTLAERIHETLQIDSLEELERSAHDGRLERVAGMGARRARTVRAVLHRMLEQMRSPRLDRSKLPSAGLLLEVDREYRRRSEAGNLRTIAPRRFNPGRRAWLPVMHLDREGWHFTALFSNTAQAHRLGRTHDWVVVYFYDEDHHEGQATVVTETRGLQAGTRVVRGREVECRRPRTKHVRPQQHTGWLKLG